MDGETRRFFNAHSEDDEIPALLYEMSGMEDKDHSLWMMNQQNYGGQRTRSCELVCRWGIRPYGHSEELTEQGWGIDYMVVTSGS